MAGVTAVELSCAELSVRELNAVLRGLPDGSAVRITEPRGRHNLAVGLTNRLDITIAGNAGYYIAGLCDGPDVDVDHPHLSARQKRRERNADHAGSRSKIQKGLVGPDVRQHRAQ